MFVRLWECVGGLVVCTLYSEVFLNLTEVFLTLTEVFPCFFLSCKANARVKLAKTGHGPHSSTLVVICVVRLFLCCSMYYFCVNLYCHRVATQLQLINISYNIISYQVLKKLEFFGQILGKLTNIKFNENPSSGSRVVPCGQTDRWTDVTKLIITFRNFANARGNGRHIQMKQPTRCSNFSGLLLVV